MEQKNIKITKASHLLDELLEQKGVEEAFLIGRDGFVIEARGNEKGVDLDNIGASVAGAISKIINLESELKAKQFKEMYVEFASKILVCIAIGDIFLAVASSNVSGLASLRFKIKNLAPDKIEF